MPSGLTKMTQVVCGVLQNGDGCYLACQRDFQRHLGGLWEFPGGKVDAGETAQQALARELREELGVEVRVGEALSNVVEWSDQQAYIQLTGFYCEVVSGKLEALEHEELRWCKKEELMALQWAEADVPLVNELMQSH